MRRWIGVPAAASVAASLLGAAYAGPTGAPQARIDRQLSPAYLACWRKGGAMSVIEHCNLREIEAQQAWMQSALQAARGRLASQESQAALDGAQAKWPARTAATCGALARRRGSMWAVEGQLCNLNLTVLRRLELEQMK